MSENIDAAISTVERQLRRAREDVARLEGELSGLRQRKWGVRPGDLVRVVGSRNPRIEGRIGMVAAVVDNGGAKPWIKAFLELKPGIYSKAPRHLYAEWEVVRDAAPA